jgi:Uma2 family endonuclease
MSNFDRKLKENTYMATVAGKLTLKEFERQFGDAKPYHEYWFGEAVPKAMPTWLHGLLQHILMDLLKEAGYRAGSEVKLKISPDFEPVPDIIATGDKIELPYPTKPFDVVVEILSPEDPFQRVLRKCKLYADWGISNVFVIDPEGREAWTWNNKAHLLETVTALALTNGKSITLKRIFDELDAALR